MSQSFDKKVGSRLQHYEPAPPPHLKEKVFKAVATQKGLNGWQVTGLALFIVSWFFWWQGGKPGISENTTDQSILMPGQEVSKPLTEKNSQPVAQNVSTSKTNNSTPIKPVNEKSYQEVNEAISIAADVSDPNHSEVSNLLPEETVNSLNEWQLEKKNGGFKQSPYIGPMTLALYKPQSTVLSKVIRPKRKSLPFYMESGLFFLYQQALPNLEDQWVITSFEGAAGLSPKRLGAFFEGGFYHVFNKKLRIHLGVKANTYRQSYAFSLRGFGADSISISQVGEEVIFEPVYEQDKIRIDHRLYSAGSKLTLNWTIFPSYTNELITSLEYLTILNPYHTFSYESQSHAVGYSDQWLFSIGLRKSLMEGEKGMLQVHPSIRYSLSHKTPKESEILSLKPYSVGISFSYLFGNFRERFK